MVQHKQKQKQEQNKKNLNQNKNEKRKKITSEFQTMSFSQPNNRRRKNWGTKKLGDWETGEPGKWRNRENKATLS